YDAVLHVGSAAPVRPAAEVAWGESAPARLLELFRSGVELVVLRGVPNARVAGDVAAGRALRAGGKLADLQAILAGAAHPDDAAALGDASGYTGVAALSPEREDAFDVAFVRGRDRKSTRLNSSHVSISYAVFC